MFPYSRRRIDVILKRLINREKYTEVAAVMYVHMVHPLNYFLLKKKRNKLKSVTVETELGRLKIKQNKIQINMLYHDQYYYFYLVSK